VSAKNGRRITSEISDARGIYNNLPLIKDSLRAKLIAGEKLAQLSKELHESGRMPL